MHPTLKDIRNINTINELVEPIKFLCDKMHSMTYGEFIAYKRTLEHQALKVGCDIKTLNEYANEYQTFGHINIK